MELVKQTRRRVLVQTRLDIAQDTDINATGGRLIIAADPACWYAGTRDGIISIDLLFLFGTVSITLIVMSTNSFCFFLCKNSLPFTSMLTSSDTAITAAEADPGWIRKDRMRSKLMVPGLFPLYQHAAATMIWNRSRAFAWIYWVISSYY